MSFSPYLGFPGTAREAMTAYQAIFGGDLQVVTWNDAPHGAAPPGTDTGLVLHAELRVEGGPRLMAADTPEGTSVPSPGGAATLYRAPDPDRARAVFDALSEGGEVVLPLGRTFWSDAFGMLADRWGQRWIVTLATPLQTEGEEAFAATS